MDSPWNTDGGGSILDKFGRRERTGLGRHIRVIPMPLEDAARIDLSPAPVEKHHSPAMQFGSFSDRYSPTIDTAERSGSFSRFPLGLKEKYEVQQQLLRLKNEMKRLEDTLQAASGPAEASSVEQPQEGLPPPPSSLFRRSVSFRDETPTPQLPLASSSFTSPHLQPISSTSENSGQYPICFECMRKMASVVLPAISAQVSVQRERNSRHTQAAMERCMAMRPIVVAGSGLKAVANWEKKPVWRR